MDIFELLAVPEPVINQATVYADGACKGNPGKGGWGSHIMTSDGKTADLCGGELDTTNNRMELMAVIRALQWFKEPYDILLHVDSQYVMNGITKWVKSWKKNGWKTASKQPVKNKDLWVKLDKLANTHSIEWRWVKGHSGDPGNEKADQLANKGVLKAK